MPTPQEFIEQACIDARPNINELTEQERADVVSNMALRNIDASFEDDGAGGFILRIKGTALS